MNPKSTRAFSLVEAAVYVGLLALVLVTVANTTLLMSRAYRELRASRHIQSSAVTALDRMVRDIRNARSVTVGASTLGVTPGVLTLETTTATGSPQTFQFYISNGALRMKQDGGDIGPLTLPGVSVSSLIFRHFVTAVSQAVKIELTLSSGTGSSTRIANFYSTARLRGSY